MKKLIIKGMGGRYFSDKIVEWYMDNYRPLPWRETADPYKIWLSEVILQQTRVAQGLPYYQQFLKHYPTVHQLAKASEQQVMRLWQGLGYYSRARNLHKCAKAIAGSRNGKFPTRAVDLEQLPGIGHYTAAAIASFAFGERIAVLDGNVFRVLSRIYGIDAPVNSSQGTRIFRELANELIPTAGSATHNQAVMEFGALFCTPKNPRCSDCPFRSNCIAYKQDLVPVLPVKIPSRESRTRYFFYLVIEKENSLLMKRREEKDIWQGLFDFVLIEKTQPATPENIFEDKVHRKWFSKTEGIKVSRMYKHILTHQTIHCHFIQIRMKSSFSARQKGLAFYSPGEIARLPKPALITRFLTEQNPH